MKSNILKRSFALLFVFCLLSAAAPISGLAQSAQNDDLTRSLENIEQKIDARRRELGIPGVSLAIVKDGKVIYAKGLGYKDFEKKLPVTADTQFAIGSTSKAFTALTVLMAADEGKLSLDDSPKKHLSYFKMFDPETDQKMTVRDLMTHSSGLNRTDLALFTGKLKKKELIQVAGEAKPVAKLHEAFNYNNIMYLAAGEVAAAALKTPWEKIVKDRIFKPLDMKNSNFSVNDMEKAKDHSLGYLYNFDSKETIRQPYRNIDEIGPAGSINSSVNDMAKWLQFILNKGKAGNKTLVSETSFNEWFKPLMKVNAANHYGLGWFLSKWKGLNVVSHGGSIDGFNAQVGLIPEKNLGMVLLTNVSSSPLTGDSMGIVFEELLGKPQSQTPVATSDGDEKNEVGKYRFDAAGVDTEVTFEKEKLIFTVPGQPAYTLEKVEPRRYKLAGAPDGFFITFKDNELFLEQPHGNYTLPKAGSQQQTVDNTAARQLLGLWEPEGGNGRLEIKESDGKVTLNLAGQQPYTLLMTGKDKFSLNPLPETYYLTAARSADGKIEKFTITQPEGSFTWLPLRAENISLTVEELQKKVIDALGGEEALKKISSRWVYAELNFANQGVKGETNIYTKAPAKFAAESKLYAAGKVIGYGRDYFDGSAGGEKYSFSQAEAYTGKRLEDLKIGSDLYWMLDWKSKFNKITILKTAKIDGEEAYVVEFEPAKGSKFTQFYSTKTFLMLRHTGVIVSSTSSLEIPYSVKYEDYRDVDGIKVAFKTTNNTISNGEVITTIKSIKHNVEMNDDLFSSKPDIEEIMISK